mmetsp:Transcript_32891/g.37873  ORF Transcript_32891/g.37873 Transcript_32891/m.37873 type:complete len:1758 (-) Transcript_32891:11-5284(-)
MNIDKAIVRKQIDSIHFGFYTDEDVRCRSVCEITSSMAVDPFGSPLPSGVYDPRLGPVSADAPPCVTCSQRYMTCSGHFGHIELCVPLYHPLLFSQIVELLRMKCLNCHKFTISARELNVFKTKFLLLDYGEYYEVQELDNRMSAQMKETREGTDSNADGNKKIGTAQKALSIHNAGLAIDELLAEIQSKYSGGRSNRKKTRNKHVSVYEQAYRRQLVKEVISTGKAAKSCSHCGAFSPKIRQDSSNKIFQSPLSLTGKRANAADGIQLLPALVKKSSKKKSSSINVSIDDNVVSDDDDDDDSDDADKNGYDSDESDYNQKDNIMVIDDDEETNETTSKDNFMHSSEVQAQVRRTWETNLELCNSLFAVQGPDIFFIQAVPVPPNRFRPPMHLGGMVVEHTQNGHLNRILQANETLRNNIATKNEAYAYTTWIELQTHFNCLVDSSKDPSSNPNPPLGIRQLLERKEGIFRKHMMGKRVNYSCRSVISPDPYIGTNEIGLPRYFAETLTYPTPVTDINIGEMRKLVERGAFQYPGARWVEFAERRVDLSKMDDHKREAIAARLLTYAKKGSKPAIVGRQLRDGDMVLMNRQPTLHKPGIMAHSVRILHNPTQKTIRMHYANCNTYNADYDGDEMNCHFPQSDLGRAEAEYIAKTDLQFIVPTDGSPLRGLIQDHVVAGVKLTKRDTFLQKWEYQQLLFAALASLPRLELIRSDARIELAPPAIIKPKALWTGKQVISTLLNHLRKGNDRDAPDRGPMPGISTERKAKTGGMAFGNNLEEHLVIIRDGELLRGVLDKSAIGATDFCLVHAVYEAYGPGKAGLLLNSLGRLFTAYIQFFTGHSCRMEDLILTKTADQVRRELIKKAYNTGSRAAKAWADSEGGKVAIDERIGNKQLKPVEAASASSKVRQLLSGSEGKASHEALDGFMMSKLNPLASDIVKACLPDGLAVPFPANTFSIMCGTGAKGSIVNQSQVSCALGQQALEGRRVPRLSSGRTLPSFAPYDVNPRADGFVMDRFLTGIRPQEYYFHCMAGREGLVDTAVKTSRSGYLQRCLVKHLEELKVHYDHTVRNGEGGIVQFLYGEDGLDPTKASYLDCSDKSYTFMARNHASLKKGQTPLPDASLKIAAEDAKRSEQLMMDPGKKMQVGEFVLARKLRFGSQWVRGAICEGWFDATIVRIDMKNGTYDIKFIKNGQIVKNVPAEVEFTRNKAVCSTCVILKGAVSDPVLSLAHGSRRLGSSGLCISERIADTASKSILENDELKKAMRSCKISNKDFDSLVAAKFTSALVNPGEAVGALAAQSVGEPSTQMTLNTFHLAGSGANVTLGIPRLREIIMTASRELKTPTMSVPLHKEITEDEAVRLTRSFTKLTLDELIATERGVTTRETLIRDDSGVWQRAYFVTLKLHPAERIKTAFGLSLQDIAKVVAKAFVPGLSYQMKLELRRSSSDYDGDIAVEGGDSSNYMHVVGKKEDSEREKSNRSSGGNDDDMLEEDDDDENDEIGEEDGVMASRTQSENYGEDDINEEGSDADTDANENENTNTNDITDDDQTTNTAFLNDSVKIDVKQNTIQLQPLRVDPSSRPLLMIGLVEKAASKTLVRAKKNIDQAFINDEDGRGRCLQIAGINFSEMWRLGNVDHSRLMSNDIWAVRCVYGVEAARSTIVNQIRSVFGVYGIEVDPRHLSLIADYMTFGGDYTAMNRTGMQEMSSPFLQMSFETTAQFLTQAALTGSSDDMNSPSANIVAGRPIRHGTGAFSLLVK